MKKTNPMLKGLPAAKKIFACSIILSMVLSLNSAFFISVAKAQDEAAPAPDMPMDAPMDAPPMDAPMDMPPEGEGDFMGETPPAPEDEDMLPLEDMGPPPEVLQDMEVTMEDLGVTEPAIKRDSAFYGLKTGLIWPIHEALVFDPINDAELKAHHGDQMLADIKDLVDDQGIENIDPQLLTDSVEWVEDKFEQIGDAASDIKDEKADQPAEVEAMLDDFTDKHFYEHKILEEFDQEITEHKDEIEGAEDVFVALKDKQDEMLEDFGEVLTTVDDPEKIPERLAEIADAQEGSSFKLIKTAEILKKLEEQVPEEGKAAIENARERTMDLLEEDMKELPAIVRAEKFEEYTAGLPGDETVQLSIFEELKQLPDIPQDMLEKIEEIKEFAVQKFEKKIEKFKKPEVKDKFFEKLTGDDLDDIMVLEELKAKISAKQDELRSRIEQEHMEGLSEFKAQFTDVESQTQAARFEKLVKEMTNNPNPKTFRLLNELEMEVAQDPEKAAFIDSVKNKAKAEFENKFREEGDRLFDRMASFDPNDMMVFREFEQEQFFDPRMMGQFMDHQTGMYKDHIQGIEDPMMFNRFQERFQYAPPEFINTMKQDNEFEDMMQFKMRNMMERELELKEREMRMQMERDWRLNEDDFQIQMRQVRNDDEKTALYAQRRESDMALMEREFDQRKMMMETRFENDPFCDQMCRDFQIQFMEQGFNNMQWNLQEDARMREFEMEMNMGPGMGFDPFAGKCDNPESCIDFCYQNPDLPECRVHEPMPMPMGPMGPMGPGYMGPGPMGPGMGPMMGPMCPEGQMPMPRGPNDWECMDDPYWKPPEFFKQCPPGNIWNEARGFCEFDEQTFQPVMDMYFGPGSMPPPGGCPPGEWWDPGRNSCIRDDGPMGPEGPYMPGEPGMPYDPYMPPMNFCGPGEYWDDMRGCVREDFKMCGPDEYFDFYEQNCRRHDWRECPPGEYWDPGRNGCMRDIMQGPVEQCPPGQFWDFYKGACMEDQWAPPPPPPMPCPAGQWWDEYMHMCTGGAGPDPMWPQECKEGMYWDAGAGQCIYGDMPTCPDNWDPVCGYDNVTYSNECYVMQAGVSWQYRGECSPNDTPLPPGQEGWCGDGYCEAYEYCPQDCETHTPGGWCGNNVCESNEDQWSCPSDCSGGGMTCTNYAAMGQGCNPSTGTCCSEGMCSDMYGPGTCVSSGGAMACNYNNTCDWDETMSSCPSDCAEPECISCQCGNYVCESWEDQWSCPSDCGESTAGCNYKTDSYSCTNEGCVWCEDTRSCYNTGHICGGGSTSCPADLYTTSAGACDYSYCPSGCNFDYEGCPSGCITSGGTACDYDGMCEPENGETIGTCPADCGSTSTCPPSSYTTSAGACDYSYCPSGCNFDYEGCPSGCTTDGGTACDYDGMCDSGESTGSCPADCGHTTYTCDYDGMCESDEDTVSCPSDCVGAIGCGSYTSSGTCTSNGCSWCEGESYPYSCFGTEHTCSSSGTCNNNGTCDGSETMSSCPADCGGGMTCNTWVGVGQACDPSTGTCCSDGMCSNMSGPGTCESSSTSGWCGDGMCDSDETGTSCPSDCGGGTGTCGNGVCDAGEDAYSCDYDCGYCGDGICDGSESQSSCPDDCGAPGSICGNGICESDEDEWSCSTDCQPASVCGDGMCDGMEDSWSCPSDCGGGGGGCNYDGVCDFDETMETCPDDCGGGMGGFCGDGMCDPGEYCPDDCGGEVMGVMSVNEINKIDAQSNIFGKVWQGIKAIFVKDKPESKPAVTAYIPHTTLRANPYLKERILWTEGDNYYKLISQYQPRVLGAKTGPRVKFPLTTIWEILTVPFK